MMRNRYRLPDYGLRGHAVIPCRNVWLIALRYRTSDISVPPWHAWSDAVVSYLPTTRGRDGLGQKSV